MSNVEKALEITGLVANVVEVFAGLTRYALELRAAALAGDAAALKELQEMETASAGTLGDMLRRRRAADADAAARLAALRAPVAPVDPDGGGA